MPHIEWESYHTCSTGSFRSNSATDRGRGGGGGSVCLKYIKLNAYLALNGESETAFFASIKLSYSFALEEKIFIIIDYCLKCTVCNTSKIILTFGFFLLHSNTQHFHQFCPVIIHTDVCWFWLG